MLCPQGRHGDATIMVMPFSCSLFFYLLLSKLKNITLLVNLITCRLCQKVPEPRQVSGRCWKDRWIFEGQKDFWSGKANRYLSITVVWLHSIGINAKLSVVWNTVRSHCSPGEKAALDLRWNSRTAVAVFRAIEWTRSSQTPLRSMSQTAGYHG